MLLIGLGSIKAKFSMIIHGHAIIQSLMAAVKFCMTWHHREFSVSEAQRHSVQPHTTWQCLLLFHLLESFLKSHMKRHLSPWNEASPLVKMSPGDWFPCYIISRLVRMLNRWCIWNQGHTIHWQAFAIIFFKHFFSYPQLIITFFLDLWHFNSLNLFKLFTFIFHNF